MREEEFKKHCPNLHSAITDKSKWHLMEYEGIHFRSHSYLRRYEFIDRGEKAERTYLVTGFKQFTLIMN